MKALIFLSLLLSFVQGDMKGQRLPQQEAFLGEIKIKVEVAKTPNELSTGLMFREKLGENEGMLFVFPAERPLNFWMKNTFIPLSVGFFDKNKKLIEVLDMQPVRSIMEANTPHYQSSKPAQYALEMNLGWFKKKNVSPGTELKY